MSVAIVVRETLAIPYTYPAPVNQGSYGGEWGSPQVTIHLEVPEGLDTRFIMAVRADDGTITLQEDPQKIEDHKAALWSQLRIERNRLLQQSDWTALSDAHLSQDKKDAWFTYRQSLRDLPANATDPTQVTWPVSPSQ